jgi:Apea-like HEPN
VLPSDLEDIDRQATRIGGLESVLARHHRLLGRLFSSESVRARELRAACRRAVQAEFSGDFGLKVALAFSCLEGLLLEPTSKEEVLGRLSEAVAHALGRSFDERPALRRRLKDLYDLRSRFVHTGTAHETSSAGRDVLDLTYRVLRREVELLPVEVQGSEPRSPA